MWLYSTGKQNQSFKALFAEDLDKYRDGEYSDWENDKQGCLALIILCDQLAPRMYKHTAQAYAYEELALTLSKKILLTYNGTKQYKYYERLVLLEPLAHSEEQSDVR